MLSTIFLVFIVFLLVMVVAANVRIVPQANVYVIERLGTYLCTWGAGLHIKVPFIDRIANRVSVKEQVVDFAPQSVITKDNVTMQIDTVVFFQVTDAKMLTYGVEFPLAAIENLTATTLRNIIGSMELDHTLTSRDFINTSITETLDKATDKWGIKVNRVEVKNIEPPKEIMAAMERQMKAEREKTRVDTARRGRKTEQNPDSGRRKGIRDTARRRRARTENPRSGGRGGSDTHGAAGGRRRNKDAQRSSADARGHSAAQP